MQNFGVRRVVEDRLKVWVSVSANMHTSCFDLDSRDYPWPIPRSPSALTPESTGIFTCTAVFSRQKVKLCAEAEQFVVSCGPARRLYCSCRSELCALDHREGKAIRDPKFCRGGSREPRRENPQLHCGRSMSHVLDHT